MSKKKKLSFQIRRTNNNDREWVRKFIIKQWGSEKIISSGKIYYPVKLSGFVAVEDKKYIGLITYKINNNSCEIITINSLKKKRGVGIALFNKVKNTAKKTKCKRIFVLTTNDNLTALRFWQKRGFVLRKIYPDSIRISRKLKPEIPKIGQYNIPIRDEIELELKL